MKVLLSRDAIRTRIEEMGREIAGTLFCTGGEALTDTRRQLIESTGSQVFSRYISHETGPVGFGCRHMKMGNTVHFFSDGLAVILHRRKAPLAEVDVDSLMFTTLNPMASRVYVNAEIDDSARLAGKNCRRQGADCAWLRRRRGAIWPKGSVPSGFR